MGKQKVVKVDEEGVVSGRKSKAGNVSIPLDLYVRLVEWANKDQRTIQMTVTRIIKQALDDLESPKD